VLCRRAKNRDLKEAVEHLIGQTRPPVRLDALHAGEATLTAGGAHGEDKADLCYHLHVLKLAIPSNGTLNQPLPQHLGIEVPVVTGNKNLKVKPLSPSCLHGFKVLTHGMEMAFISAVPIVARSVVSSGQLDRSKSVEVAFRTPVSRLLKHSDTNSQKLLVRRSLRFLKLSSLALVLLIWTPCQVLPAPTSSMNWCSLGPGFVYSSERKEVKNILVILITKRTHTNVKL